MCGEDCKSAASFILNPETRPRKWAMRKRLMTLSKKASGEKMESVTKWGGQRPGAGRSLKEEKAENRTLRVTDRLWEAARIAAGQEGKTRTRWITELMQREIDKKNSAQD